MKLKTKHMLAPSSAPKCIAKGILMGLLVTVPGAMAMAKLMVMEIIKETAIGYCAMGIILAASISAALTSMKSAEGKHGIIAATTGAGYALVLLLLNALLYKGGYEGVGVTLLLILGGTAAAVLLGTRPRKAGYASKKKRKHR